MDDAEGMRPIPGDIFARIDFLEPALGLHVISLQTLLPGKISLRKNNGGDGISLRCFSLDFKQEMGHLVRFEGVQQPPRAGQIHHVTRSSIRRERINRAQRVPMSLRQT